MTDGKVEHKRFRVLLLHSPEQRVAKPAAQWMEQILAEVDWYESIQFDVYENATNAVLRTQPEVVWVEAVYTVSQAVSVVEELAANFPEMPIVSCSYENEPYWTRRAFRVGAWDHVDEKTVFPYLAALRERILRQLEVRTAPTSDSTAPGCVPPLRVLLCREESDIKNNAGTDKLMKGEAERLKEIGRVSLAELMTRAESQDFDMIWICTDQPGEALVPLVSQLQSTYPKVCLLVSYFGKDVEVPRTLLRLGIQDVLVKHWDSELASSLDALVPRKVTPFTASSMKAYESGSYLAAPVIGAWTGCLFFIGGLLFFSPLGAAFFGGDPTPNWILSALQAGVFVFAIITIIGTLWARRYMAGSRPWAVFGVKYPFAAVPADARPNRLIKVIVNGLEQENSKAFVVADGVTIEFTKHVGSYTNLRGFTLPWNQVAALEKLGDQAVFTLKDGQIVSLPYRIFEKNENVPEGLLAKTDT